VNLCGKIKSLNHKGSQRYARSCAKEKSIKELLLRQAFFIS
jgi:hypothetical protein